VADAARRSALRRCSNSKAFTSSAR
jgi:hypothetical protein